MRELFEEHLKGLFEEHREMQFKYCRSLGIVLDSSLSMKALITNVAIQVSPPKKKTYQA